MPSAGCANAAGLSQLLIVPSPYGLSSTWFARCVVAWIPESARSVPVKTVSGAPELRTEDPRQPPAGCERARSRVAELRRLDARAEVEDVLPPRAAPSLCPRRKSLVVSASEGGLISDTGFMYPVATLSGAWPWLIKPSHVDTV